MQLEVILPLVAYLVVVFGISVYAMRKRSTGTFLNEYFLGSRSMGGIVLAMTLTATYISASSFIGGPGAAYKYGLGWVLLAMIQLPAVWLSLGILGKKFAILARRYNAVTLNDMLFARYQSRLLVWLASLSLLVAFIGAMTVQFIGGARLLETAAGIPYETGLLIFGISIALYTAFGGFRASVLNDTMQGLVMLIGTTVLLIGVVHAAGGLSNAVETLQSIDPQLVTPQGADDILSPAFMTSFWVLVCFGVIGLPHTAVRCISYKDSKAVHRGGVDGRLVRELRQGEGPSLVPPDLPGVHRQPHQAQHRENPSEQTHLSGVTEVLQEAAQQRQSGADREQETEQGPEPQDGEEPAPDHCLGHEAGQRTEAHRHRPHGRMRPAEAGAQGDENASSGAVGLLPAGGERERCIRALLRGAGHRPAAG